MLILESASRWPNIIQKCPQRLCPQGKTRAKGGIIQGQRNMLFQKNHFLKHFDLFFFFEKRAASSVLYGQGLRVGREWQRTR